MGKDAIDEEEGTGGKRGAQKAEGGLGWDRGRRGFWKDDMHVGSHVTEKKRRTWQLAGSVARVMAKRNEALAKWGSVEEMVNCDGGEEKRGGGWK